MLKVKRTVGALLCAIQPICAVHHALIDTITLTSKVSAATDTRIMSRPDAGFFVNVVDSSGD
jgi:hypothetical protein